MNVSGTSVLVAGTVIGTITHDGQNGANLRVLFNANATPTAVEALIEHITYRNTSDTPAASRTLSFTITDNGGNTSVARTAVIAVTAEDEAIISSGEGGTSGTGGTTTNTGRVRYELTEQELGVVPEILNARFVLSDVPGEEKPGEMVEVISSTDTVLPEEGGALFLIGAAVHGGGSGNKDYIVGNLLQNDLVGRDGNDTIIGLSGQDTIFGNTDNDSLFGGFGDDSIYAGQGNDQLIGNGENDLLHGNLGNDTLYGNVGDDTLMGNAGNDSIAGGQEDDVIAGGAGADMLLGNMGDDVLYGDAGNDVFVISANEGMDVIADFHKGDALMLLGTGRTATQLLASATQVQGGVFIALGDGGVTLLGLALGQLAESDILIG